MKRYFTIIIISIFFSACGSHAVHSDCKEYGYAGKIRQIRKITINELPSGEPSEIPVPGPPDLVETYYVSPAGNFDSLITERKISATETFTYTRRFEFENGKRKSWEGYNPEIGKLMSGTIKWISEKQYEEKVISPEGKLKFEAVYNLNNSFRIYKILVKSYNKEGDQVLNSVQDISLSEAGEIISIKTTNSTDNTTGQQDFQYISKDKTGNPTEIQITKQSDHSKSLIKLEYQYYN